MSLVAAVSPLSRLEGDAASITAQMRSACAWVSVAGAEEAEGAVDFARMAREAMRIRRMASSLAAEATRLEAHALRRLGQLGAFDGLTSDQAGCARNLATYSDEEWAVFLDAIKGRTTATAVWKRTFDDATDAQEDALLRRQVRGGMRPEEHQERWGRASFDSLREAAVELLRSAFGDASSFTAAEGVDRLAERLSVDAHDPVVRRGLNQVLLKAIVARDAEVPDGRLPYYITFYDSGHEFIRVPQAVATLEQLEAMVLYREGQAAALVEAAQGLRSKYEVLKARRPRCPDSRLRTIVRHLPNDQRGEF